MRWSSATAALTTDAGDGVGMASAGGVELISGVGRWLGQLAWRGHGWWSAPGLRGAHGEGRGWPDGWSQHCLRLPQAWGLTPWEVVHPQANSNSKDSD